MSDKQTEFTLGKSSVAGEDTLATDPAIHFGAIVLFVILLGLAVSAWRDRRGR